MKRIHNIKSIAVFLVFSIMTSLTINFGTAAYAVANPDFNGIPVEGTYNMPIDIDFDSNGNIYTVDYGDSRIIKLDSNGKNPTLVSPSGGITLNSPTSIRVGPDGKLYVSDFNNNRIIRMDTDGKNATTIYDNSIPESATHPKILYATELNFDNTGYLYVTNYGIGNILKMKNDGTSSSIVVSGFLSYTLIGSEVDSAGNIYCIDRNSNIVKEYDKNGNYQKTFISSGFNTPLWITIDDNNELYVSDAGNYMIKKFDTYGRLNWSYANDGYDNMFGTKIDKNGYIYFCSFMGNAVYKIVGNAITTDATHIVLETNYGLTNTAGDHAAFTIHGATSNPTVTNVAVSGTKVTLTLSSPVIATDNVTLDYTKTGNNNLHNSVNSKDLDGFDGLKVKNTVLNITSVNNIADISVENGSSVSSIGLPDNVNVTLSDSTTTTAAVTWDNGTSVSDGTSYNGNKAGTYIFRGTLTMPAGVVNPNSVKASVNVIVKPGNNPVRETTPAAVRIVGPTKVGNTLSAELLDNNDDPCTTTSAAVTYQWYRLNSQNDGFSNMIGNGSETYTLTDADAGKYIGLSADVEGAAHPFKVISGPILANSTNNNTSSNSNYNTNGSSGSLSGHHHSTTTSDDDTAAEGVNQESDANNSIAKADGWIQSEGKWEYFKNGKLISGWQQINGIWYLFDVSGIMQTGWKEVNGVWYLLKDNGAMANGWQNVNSKWYFMKDSGEMAKGWQEVNGIWYLLKEDGSMAIGWQEADGQWYYLYSDGAMAKDTSIDGYNVGDDGNWIQMI